ncbi:hypothetical protein HDU98_005849, partial [Podochytrium sp. JEL0797]
MAVSASEYFTQFEKQFELAFIYHTRVARKLFAADSSAVTKFAMYWNEELAELDFVTFQDKSGTIKSG